MLSRKCQFVSQKEADAISFASCRAMVPLRSAPPVSGCVREPTGTNAIFSPAFLFLRFSSNVPAVTRRRNFRKSAKAKFASPGSDMPRFSFRPTNVNVLIDPNLVEMAQGDQATEAAGLRNSSFAVNRFGAGHTRSFRSSRPAHFAPRCCGSTHRRAHGRRKSGAQTRFPHRARA